MKFKFGLFVMWMGLHTALYGQSAYFLSGHVTDETGSPMPGSYVQVKPDMKGAVTDRNGYFGISGLPSGLHRIEISFLGYERFIDTLDIRSDQTLTAMLIPQPQTLDEVVIRDNYAERRKREDPRSVEVVNEQFIRGNLSGSLMQSLERLPGVGAIEIGAGQSKPVIRGLGFNRVVVIENGIKHEGQQWGEDHGLEIDQYAVERVEIIKGPASLMVGSDAIAGTIELKQIEIPAENTFGGSIDVTGKSNNNFLGGSLAIYARKKRVYVSSRVTLTEYADYRVPADSVDIYSYRAPLYKRHLRNTAGQERDLHLSAGFAGEKFSNRMFISYLNSKAGFFANAHGLEPRRVDTGLHDKSDRDIQDPYQQVTHTKIINKSEFRLARFRVETDMAFQNNFREEWSPYVSHGYMPPVFPDSLPWESGLELAFDKDVYSGNVKGFYFLSDKIVVSGGLNLEKQVNRIGGRGFIIPAFTQNTTGVFAYGKWTLSAKTMLQGGIRYDFGKIRNEAYSDWFLSPDILSSGDTAGYAYVQRAPGLNRSFSNTSWAIGFNYNPSSFSLKANIGKSFRMPIAKELFANGVNYHHFSYEKGNPELSAETSYQVDLGLEWSKDAFAVGFSPYLNYFPNYIYLNPTYKHDYLYGAGNQVFLYTQSEVLRFGAELHIHYDVLKNLTAGLIGESVFSEQLSGDKKGFTLPFSPPSNLLFHLRYQPGIGKPFYESYLAADYLIASRQNKVVPPEEQTPGSQVLNISAGTSIKVGSVSVSLSIQVQNLFNTKYFNHTSYYRIIHVPEAGRNVVIHVSVPFVNSIRSKSNH